MTTLDLLQNLILGIVLVCVSIFVQGSGLVDRFARVSQACIACRPTPNLLAPVRCALAFLIIAILVGHLLQTHVWGSAFYLLSYYFLDFRTAQHFASQTYTTLGYGDILLPLHRRMLSGWLALTGLLMVGWSTALFVYLVTKYIEAHGNFRRAVEWSALIGSEAKAAVTGAGRTGTTLGSRVPEADEWGRPTARVLTDECHAT